MNLRTGFINNFPRLARMVGMPASARNSLTNAVNRQSMLEPSAAKVMPGSSNLTAISGKPNIEGNPIEGLLKGIAAANEKNGPPAVPVSPADNAALLAAVREEFGRGKIDEQGLAGLRQPPLEHPGSQESGTDSLLVKGDQPLGFACISISSREKQPPTLGSPTDRWQTGIYGILARLRRFLGI